VGRKEFKDTIVNLNKEGVTIFFSSHIVSDVEAICEKVVLLEGGKCVYEGNIDSLIDEHVKPNYFVKYIGESKVVEEVVSIEEKDSKIQKLISDGVNIVEVQRDKPTLEEIVYRLER
jgi:ABC-2 type transport system ATP-binding protein